MGGGVLVLTCAIVGVMALGNHWTRAWCGVFLGMWFLGLSGALITGHAPLCALAYPPVLWLIAVFVRGVVRTIERV